MSNKYIRALKKSKIKIRRKLYAAVALFLIASVMVGSVSYAWLILSRAPEVSGVTSTIGSNGNLEIALATAEHLAELKQNNMYEPEGKEFIMATGDRVHDNVLWGNLVDLLDIEYGLHTLNMRPALLNVLDGKVAEIPVTVAGYGVDGRLEAFDLNNPDFKKVGLGAVFNADTARSDVGSVTMSRTDVESGNFDKNAIINDIMDNSTYGVRLAGPLDYSGRFNEETDEVSVDFYVDGYCFAIDLLFRTNAPVANLMLQTEAVQRMESELEEEYQGQGSFIELNNSFMTAAISVVFADTLTGEVRAIAQADPKDGKLWIVSRMNENGELVQAAEDDAAYIMPLTQNRVTALTAWVFLNGALVDNSAAAIQGDSEMKLNLQFSTDAVLNPAYTDIDAEQTYPNRPDLDQYPGAVVPTNPTEPVDPNAPTTPVSPSDPTLDVYNVDYYVDGGENNTYSIYAMNTAGQRAYDLQLSGTVDQENQILTVNSVQNYPTAGVVIPSTVTDEATGTAYAVSINTSRPFGSLTLPEDASMIFLSKGGTKVGIASNSMARGVEVSLEDMFETSRSSSYYRYGVNFASVDMRGLDTAGVTSMKTLFSRCSELTKVRLGGLDTSSVTDMESMFSGCTKLTSLDFSGLNTANVQNMSSMLYNCNSLTAVNLSSLDTSSVTNMSYMFYGCYKLTSLDLSSFDTANVTDMSYMFAGYGGRYNSSTNYPHLADLDISSFDTSNVTNMSYMFYDCIELTQLDLRHFNTSRVTDMSYMFASDRNSGSAPGSKLAALDISSFNTSNVTDMGYMFYDCVSLTELDVSHFDTAKVMDMSYMFAAYNSYDGTNSSLKTLNLGDMDTSAVITMSHMFSGCCALTSLDVTGLDTSRVTNMSGMFENCSALTSLDVSGFDTAAVGNMSRMFYDCPGLTELDVKNFDTANVTSMNHMFFLCSGLEKLDVTNFNTAKVTDMSGMFRSCRSLKELDVSGFNTANVTSMSYMFSGSSKLTAPDVSGFNTANVTNMSHMFENCYGMKELDVSGFNTAKVTKMNWMFYYCSGLTELDLRNFDTAKVTDMDHMFAGCSKLTSIDLLQLEMANVTDIGAMFDGCRSLTELNLTPLAAATKITTMYALFEDCSGLTELDVSPLNTSKVTGLYNMFAGCSGLTKLDLSTFDTSSVTNMGAMFSGCTNLAELNLDGWDTSLVSGSGENYDNVGMNYMFANCKSLTRLDLSDFDTTNLAKAGAMFQNCTALETIISPKAMGDLSLTLPANYKCAADGYVYAALSKYVPAKSTMTKTTEAVSFVDGRYYAQPDTGSSYTIFTASATGARNYELPVTATVNETAKTLTISKVNGYPASGIVIPGQVRMGNGDYAVQLGTDDPFANVENTAAKVTILEVNGQKVKPTGTSLASMFSGGAYTSMDMRGLDTSNVTDMLMMFYDCSSLTTLDVSAWDTAKVSGMGSMFSGCTSLTELDVSNWDTGNVLSMSGMFYDCESLTHLDVGNWNVGRVTNMYSMFSDCSALTTLDVSKWNTEKVLNMSYLFSDCYALESVDVSNFKTSKVTNMESMFDNCEALTYVDVSNFDTSKVTNMSWMFYYCKSLTQLDVSGFDTANVTNMDYMFAGCEKLTFLDLSGWDMSKATSHKINMFDNCPAGNNQ